MPREDRVPSGGPPSRPVGDATSSASNGKPVRAVHDGASSDGFEEVGEAVLPCGSAAPRAARAAVSEWLSGLVGAHKLDDIRLVVTELVANSVRHAQLEPGDAVTLRIQLAERSLRVEVANPGTAGEIASNGGGRHAGGGLGLQMVARLCVAWGIARDRDTTVWGEMELAGR